MKDYPKYVWAVVPKKFDGCLDIRRYAFSYEDAVEQLKHVERKGKRGYKTGYREHGGTGTWTLFKLVQVNKRGKKK